VLDILRTSTNSIEALALARAATPACNLGWLLNIFIIHAPGTFAVFKLRALG
jgi:hypothetical protein